MIDEAQIQYLERLARIRLDPEQRAGFREEIGRILTYMERLAAVDDAVEPAVTQTGAIGSDQEANGAESASPAAVAGSPAAVVGSPAAVAGSPAAMASADCRPDALRPSLERQVLLAMSPQATEEYMTVPRAVQ